MNLGKRFTPHPRTLGTAAILLVMAGLFVYFASTETPQGSAQAVLNGTPDRGAIQIFFTTPGDPASRTLRGGPDASLAEAIDHARTSVDVAVYHLDLWSIRDALLRAHRRGVQVRVILESEHMDEPEVRALSAAGVAVVGDDRPALMHHKFVVIDQYQVWTGSMNLTVGGAYYNRNNSLRIASRELAADFRGEFDEMFREQRFGALSIADTPFPTVLVQDVTVEVLFSPDDGVSRRLVELITAAEDSIEIMVYTLTAEPLAHAIAARAAEGVRVRAVWDASQVRASGSQYDALHSSGLEVRRLDAEGLMHHKVFIVDGTSVVTGSYNFTRSAEERNDENVLILHSPAIAAEYLLEFEELYAAALP
jgi:phosphatidylserine/phosphatidylglycerophosphate/cardiolipin synthase-like enzyme